MLKSKVLADLLAQANTGGVRNTVLLNNEGSLLAYAGENDRDSKVRATIASSIWVSYEKQGKLLSPPSSAKQMILTCQDGSVFVIAVPGGLLCLLAGKATGIGMLRRKAETLAAYLEEPLKMLAT